MPWLNVYDFTLPVYQWLAQQLAGSVVYEVPTMGHMGDQARDASYLYWSTKHRQPLVNGYSDFIPAGLPPAGRNGRSPARGRRALARAAAPASAG